MSLLPVVGSKSLFNPSFAVAVLSSWLCAPISIETMSSKSGFRWRQIPWVCCHFVYSCRSSKLQAREQRRARWYDHRVLLEKEREEMCLPPIELQFQWVLASLHFVSCWSLHVASWPLLSTHLYQRSAEGHKGFRDPLAFKFASSHLLIQTCSAPLAGLNFAVSQALIVSRSGWGWVFSDLGGS